MKSETSEGLRVLVCGGRDFADRIFLSKSLDRLHRERGIAAVISGAARGADSLASEWARHRQITLHEFPADWNTHGKSAGAIRNQRMLDEGLPSYVVAFSGGNGTRDMINRAGKKGLTVWEPK